MEHDVFISYSRKDTAIVDQFVDRLTDAGYSVWIDRDGIYSGDEFKKKIVQAIKKSSIVLFFSSVNSNASDWTIKEISYSLKKGKTIIPIRLDDSEYEDNIDFDLVNIDFIQSDPNQPSACIGRLITSLAAHGCKRSGNKGTGISDATPQKEMSPEELVSLGVEHFNNEEYEQAIECFRKAAEQGNASAQNKLGLCYHDGKGVAKNYSKAIEWYLKAANQGNNLAQCNIGVSYFYGHGVEQDYKKAVKWYKKAATQGQAQAQCNLGSCYFYGNGVEIDYKKATDLFKKAAEQGVAKAQFNLGMCLYYGHGVEQDYEEAIMWYGKAAEQGHAGAQCNLGVCYEYGQGVTQNPKEAIKWYSLAAEQGLEDAIEALKRLNAW